MPTYEYRCQACSHEHEAFQAMSAAPLRKCPKCGKLKLKRLIGTGAGIIFKGSGFYQTDYRSESYKSAAKAETEKASPKSESKSSSKSDNDGKTTATPVKSDSSGNSSVKAKATSKES